MPVSGKQTAKIERPVPSEGNYIALRCSRHGGFLPGHHNLEKRSAGDGLVLILLKIGEARLGGRRGILAALIHEGTDFGIGLAAA
jgi:hypothetical protein